MKRCKHDKLQSYRLTGTSHWASGSGGFTEGQKFVKWNELARIWIITISKTTWNWDIGKQSQIIQPYSLPFKTDSHGSDIIIIVIIIIFQTYKPLIQ